MHGLGDVGASLVVPVAVRVDVGDLLIVVRSEFSGGPHVLPPLDVLPVSNTGGGSLLRVANEEDGALDLGQAVERGDVKDDKLGSLRHALALEGGGERSRAGNDDERGRGAGCERQQKQRKTSCCGRRDQRGDRRRRVLRRLRQVGEERTQTARQHRRRLRQTGTVQLSTEKLARLGPSLVLRDHVRDGLDLARGAQLQLSLAYKQATRS